MAATRIEQIDHTADVGLRIWALDAASAFAAAAGGMLDIMVNRDRVEERQEWEINVQAGGWDDLLVAWLEEILYRFEMGRLVPREIMIREIAPEHLTAELRGETFDPARHEAGVQIKAVTYHQLRAEQTSEGFEIQVILDI